jgi:hypothetical protein
MALLILPSSMKNPRQEVNRNDFWRTAFPISSSELVNWMLVETDQTAETQPASTNSVTSPTATDPVNLGPML